MTLIHDQTIVVTGGFGFIGNHLITTLLTQNPKKIIVIDSLDYGIKNTAWAQHPLISFHQLTLGLCTEKQLVNILSGADICFHLAAEKYNQSKGSPDDVLSANVMGMYHLLSACVKTGIKKVIFSSSLYVYGKTTSSGFHERQIPSPHTLYGSTKCMGEHLCETMYQQFGLDYTICRYFFVYGPKQYQGLGYKSVIIKNFERLKQNLPPIIFGDGLQTLDYIYIDDVIHATIEALDTAYSRDIFDIASANPISIVDLTQLMINISHFSGKPIYEPQDETHQTNRYSSSQKATQSKLLRLTTPIERGLEYTYKWIIEQ